MQAPQRQAPWPERTEDLARPDAPVKVALIGAGARSHTIYRPLFDWLKPWMEITAVCDPVKKHCDNLASTLGAPAYYDIHALVKDKPMEAALIITPIESHYPLTMFLLEHGIHCHTETTWMSMSCQARDVVRQARARKLVVRVAENFIRFPIDRFAQKVMAGGHIGRVARIFSYADHTGYHNDSRWIRFAGCPPDWVQSIEHEMAHPAFYSQPQRRHEQEALKMRFFHFPNDFVVMDTGSGHVKGHLGRHPRAGYTEWQGERGALVFQAPGPHWSPADTPGELRRVSDDKLAPAQEAKGAFQGGGVADEISRVVVEREGDQWTRIYADTPSGRLEHINAIRPSALSVHTHFWYGVAICDHCIDFALAVRGLRASEYTDEDALAAMMMEIGAMESNLNEGKRIRLPLEGDLEADAAVRQKLKAKYNVDPMDIEAMLKISYPQP